LPLQRGFSKLETLPEGFAARMTRKVEIGDTIGERYRVIDKLGGGAMGEVYLAENLTIGLRVAVKLLKPELLANPDFRIRFKHEAEAVAAIQHPNVARFLDLIVDDPTFLVMEYVTGPTLDAVLAKEGPLAPRRAADIATRLCWGLAAAHRAGVIHRDLKPLNILLMPDEENGEVPKLIDFGLAKLAASQKGAPLTRIGQIIGTPQYMAPEQIGGKDVDERADVYALGCVLYAMLAGRPPFVGSSDDLDVLYRQVHEPAEPVTRLASHVTPQLEAVVMRALEKDPAQRFQSCREFARALVPAVEKRAPRPSPEDAISGHTQVIRAPKRRWALLALAFSALCLAAVVLFVARADWSPPKTLLLLVTDPAGASIEVDGKRLAEHTPAALHGLPAGEHEVRLSSPHHADVARHVRVENDGRELVEVKLPPSSHTFEVVSTPPSATVYLDGELVAGKTPVSVTVTDDEYHQVRIEKPGYETATRKLSPEDNAAWEPALLQPETQARGTLFADAGAPAELWIDGLYSGFMTPTPGVRLSAGEHVLELRTSAGISSEKTRVLVGKGETLRVVLPMPKTRRK
jgi:serine/threonine protein kinase